MTNPDIHLFSGEALNSRPDASLPSLLEGKLDLLKDLNVTLDTCLGHCEMSLAELSQLKAGAVLALDRAPADPVDILLGGRVVARGCLVVAGDYYGIRVDEVSALIA